jgi:glucose-6-phosphate isomerase
MVINSEHRQQKYKNLEVLAQTNLNITDLMKTEPNRIENFVMREGPLRADFSKQRVSERTLNALKEYAASCGLEEYRAKLFSGEKINNSEGRAVLHMALRGVGGSKGVQETLKLCGTG